MRIPTEYIALALASAAASASGCGGSIASTSDTQPNCPASSPVTGVSLTGRVSADLQPVVKASVQLYAAGDTGNGSKPTALLTAPLTSDASGDFTVPSGYTCPSAQTPIFLLSKGGQPGSTSANSALWLMTAIGPCGNVVAGNKFVMNEVTTAAAIWALAPFIASGGSVGASCTNSVGLNNAFATAANLADASKGSSPGAAVPSTVTVDSNKLNTLANALTSCTASDAGNSCSQLFNASVSGNTIPGNTLDATLNIVRAPGKNVAAIYSLASGNAMFSPALSAAPPDWMLFSTITGGGMSMPSSVSIATSGNIWVSSYLDTVSEFTPDGAAVFPSGITGNGINQSFGMALDTEGNVWIANEQTKMNSGLGDVTRLNSSGQAQATGITNGGIDFPVAVTADSNGNMWVVNYGDSTVTLLNSSGSPVSGTKGWGGNSLDFPVALAVDSNHNAWVANQAGELQITKISAGGSQITNYSCDCNGASGVAADQNNNIWVANYYGDSVSELSSDGTLLLGAITGGGVEHPQGIAVDGAGTVWVANYHGNSLSEINGSTSSTPGSFLSPSSGFGSDAGLLEPYALAIDASGSVWVSNFGSNTLTQFIGAAVPVKTPLAGPPRTP